MFQFRRLGLCIALGAILACSVVSVPFAGDLFAPGGVEALEGYDPPVTVPSTDPEPVPCGIDAAADPCPEATPDAFPIAVVQPLEVDALPDTGGYRGREGTDWFGLLVILGTIALIGGIALAGTVYGYNRAEREREHGGME